MSPIPNVLFDAEPHTHKIYQELLNHPPLRYTFPKYPLLSRLYKRLTKDPHVFGSATLTYGADLIHSPQRLLSSCPYVIDCEHPAAFVNLRDPPTSRSCASKVKSWLKRSNLKQIIAFSDAAKTEISKYYGFSEKISVVRPVHSFIGPQNLPSNESPRLLFIGPNFYAKGGHLLFRAISRLSPKHDFKLLARTDLPHGIRVPDQTEILPRLSDHEIANLYATSDVIIYPTLHAGLGVLTEAQAYQRPIITTNIYENPEFVREGGICIPTELDFYSSNLTWIEFINRVKNTPMNQTVSALTSAIETLLNSYSLRKQMSKFFLHETKTGTFSVRNRNKLLLDIYHSSVR